MGDIVISPAAAVALTSLGGVIAVVVRAIYTAMIGQFEARLKEHKDTIVTKDEQIKEQTVALKEQTVAIRSLSEVIDSWNPERQRGRVRG